MAPVVEHLCSKHKALSSNPVLLKKKSVDGSYDLRRRAVGRAKVRTDLGLLVAFVCNKAITWHVWEHDI
jgi:hypothetical protein